MAGSSERAGGWAAGGCLAGLVYGAIAAAFLFDRYVVIGNVYRLPRGPERLAFSACLALAYATIGLCAGALAAAAARILRRCARPPQGLRASLWAAAIGLFAWAETASYLNGTAFVFEWGRRVYVRGWRVRAALFDPRILAANAILAAGCLAAALILGAFLKRASSPRVRATALWAAALFAAAVVPVNCRLPRLATAASLGGNALLAAGCLAGGRLLAAAGERLRGRAAWAAPCVPAVLVLSLLAWRDPQAKAVLFFRSPRAARLCLRALNAAVDFDRDFFSPLTPAGDCDNRDARVNPLAVDFPGNGADEDCVGGDFSCAEYGQLEEERARRRAWNAESLEAGAEFRRRRWGGERPDIFLVIVDALRSDHLGINGYRRPTSPELDALMRGGVFFRRCITPSSVTHTSLPAIFASRHPSALARGGAAVPIQRLLSEGGYATAAFSSITSPEHGALGIVREGFGHCDEPRLEGRYRYDAGEVTERVLRFLDGHRGGGPLFAAVCYSNTHASYPCPPPFRCMFGAMEGRDTIFIPRGNDAAWMELRYDRAIAYTDGEIGRLVRRIEARRPPRPAVVVVTSDHGEEFYEHGGLYHGVGLHAELTTVPLGFLAAGERGEGRVVGEAVQSLDIAPTLCALAGAPVPAEAEGWSLVSALAGGALPPERDLVSETVGRSVRLMALTRGGYRLIRDFYSGGDLLYNTADDPGERRDLSGSDPARAGLMARDLCNFRSYVELGGSSWCRKRRE